MRNIELIRKVLLFTQFSSPRLKTSSQPAINSHNSKEIYKHHESFMKLCAIIPIFSGIVFSSSQDAFRNLNEILILCCFVLGNFVTKFCSFGQFSSSFALKVVDKSFSCNFSGHWRPLFTKARKFVRKWSLIAEGFNSDLNLGECTKFLVKFYVMLFNWLLPFLRKDKEGWKGNQEIELEPLPLKNYIFIDRTAVI